MSELKRLLRNTGLEFIFCKKQRDGTHSTNRSTSVVDQPIPLFLGFLPFTLFCVGMSKLCAHCDKTIDSFLDHLRCLDCTPEVWICSECQDKHDATHNIRTVPGRIPMTRMLAFENGRLGSLRGNINKEKKEEDGCALL